MAKAQTETQTNFADDDGWETESQESAIKVTFEKPGDQFTGIKVGQRWIDMGDGEGFTVFQFAAQGMTELGLEDGTLCDIQESFKLKPLADIADGKLVRITRMRDVEVGRPQPMKDYRIQSRSV